MTTQPPSKRPDRYRLYVDESGDHTFAHAGSPNQYLALLGVWFRQRPEYDEFADSLNGLVRRFFGASPDDPIHLHRKDMIHGKGPFRILREPIVRARFDDALIEVIRSAAFRAVCVVIDKAEHHRRGIDPIHPYHACLAALMDRYCGWLRYKNAVGDVTAEARGRTEDSRLREAYANVFHVGTAGFRPGFHSGTLTTKDLKLKRKADNIPGLVLADLLAHPAKTAVLAEYSLADPVMRGFGYELQKVIAEKLHRDDTGRVPGHGTLLI